jgi:hypothetical protein
VAGIYVRADIKGIDELMAKMRGNPIFAEPWREALKTLTDRTYEAEQRAAAKFTHHGPGEGLASHIYQKMDTRPIPEWGYVSQTAVSSGGPDKKRGGPFRYAWALNASDRYHYAGTGVSTKDWFYKPLARMKRVTQDVLERAAKKIEALWQQ